MLTLYSMPDSGNSYKPRLLLAQLGIPFKHVAVDTGTGDTHTAEFIAKNPNGKAPLLELDDGRFLAESNAMLLHLAEGTPYLPADAYERALCLSVDVLRAIQPRTLHRRAPLAAAL